GARSGLEAAGPVVLLADDRLEILALHSSYLHDHGYAVLTAGDGETALEYARSHRPAVIVLDQSMPGLTGTEVARALKRDPATAEIPILMMTAHSYGAVGRAARAAGCELFLPKPVEPSRMLREVAARAAPFGR
ncbi:MAG: response regulator, partial [Gemmatimonadota bacterium]